MIAQLQQDQADQKIRSAAMSATSDELATKVTALGDIMKGQAAAIAEISANVASLQASVGSISAAATATAASVADLTAKIDQLLNNALTGGGRRDSAMGVGKDDADSSDTATSARKKVKKGEGADATSAGTA